MAWRRLSARPVLTLLSVAALGLVIGAGSVIFSAVYAVLLHPLPYFEPERLVSLTGSDLSRPGGHEVEMSFGDFREWERRNHVLAGGALYSRRA